MSSRGDHHNKSKRSWECEIVANAISPLQSRFKVEHVTHNKSHSTSVCGYHEENQQLWADVVYELCVLSMHMKLRNNEYLIFILLNGLNTFLQLFQISDLTKKMGQNKTN